MDQIYWNEKSIDLRSLVDNTSIKKPTLALIHNRPAIVGAKINGQFIIASPCKIKNDHITAFDHQIVLSSRYRALWKIIAKGTSTTRTLIHRLTTTDIERIFKQDIEKERAIPRSYICTRPIEAFDLISYPEEDPTVLDGQRIDRKVRRIEENVEFEVSDIGEVEYTPTEGERTSQDYAMAPKQRRFPFRSSANKSKELLVRNRVLRTLHCTMKNDSHKRHFILEVNEQPCDIRPIASEGSAELRYLHSTQNIFDYIISHDNTVHLYARLVRGDFPKKTAEFGGYIMFRKSLIGDQVPICYAHNYQLSLVNPDSFSKTKLPMDNNKWHSVPEFHTAELQCMQLSLALFSRHESEVYVTFENEQSKTMTPKSHENRRQLQHQQEPFETFERQFNDLEINSNDQLIKSRAVNTFHSEHPALHRTWSNDDKIIVNQQSVRSSSAKQPNHPASDMLYRDHERRARENNVHIEQQRFSAFENSQSTKPRVAVNQEKRISTSAIVSTSTHKDPKKIKT